MERPATARPAKVRNPMGYSMNTTQAIWAGVKAAVVHYNAEGAWAICGQASLSGGPARGYYTKDPLQATVEPDLTPY